MAPCLCGGHMEKEGAIISLTLTLLWIRTQNPSKRAAADLLLRPRGHWDQQLNLLHSGNMYMIWYI